MEILLIIVVGVIISIVSAAGKKKPNQSSEDAAPVRPTISDIQRAFMMSGEMEAPPRREPAAAATQTSEPVTAKQTEIAAERLSARTFETAPASKAGMNKYANIDLGSFHHASADIDDDTPLKIKKKQRGGLNLFEDKDDFVRAVIYSEILTRKAR